MYLNFSYSRTISKNKKVLPAKHPVQPAEK
jgi:hypothetical protein